MWSKGAYFILDMRVANTDAASYVLKTPEKGLFAAEPGKKILVPGYLSPATPSLFPLCHLSGKPDGQRDGG